MRFIFILSVFLFAVSSLCAQSPIQDEIPFQVLPSGHILIKAKVEGVEGSFIFDTGAGITVFTKAFFTKLTDTVREDGGYTGFRATGERLDVDLYKVKNVQLGKLQKATEEVSYLDMNLGGIDGILSLKLLEHKPFTIDLEKQVLRLVNTQTVSSISKKASSIPLQLEQSRDKSLAVFAFFKVNDTLTLQFSLDSGAGKEVYRLHSKYMQQLGVDGSDTVHVKRIDKKSEINEAYVSHIYITQLKKLATIQNGAVAIKDFPVQFVDGLIYDGIIWINWLGKQLTFDLDNKRLLVQR